MLTDAQKRPCDENGYLLVEDVATPEEFARMREMRTNDGVGGQRRGNAQVPERRKR